MIVNEKNKVRDQDYLFVYGQINVSAILVTCRQFQGRQPLFQKGMSDENMSIWTKSDQLIACQLPVTRTNALEVMGKRSLYRLPVTTQALMFDRSLMNCKNMWGEDWEEIPNWQFLHTVMQWGIKRNLQDKFHMMQLLDHDL